MDRKELIHDTREVLAKAGFYISEDTDSRMICFDLVARRDDILIIFKILSNVDSFSKYNAKELNVVSKMLRGAPVLIGERNSQKKIEPGIIYLRYGITMFNSETLKDIFLEGVPPIIFSAPGGFYVNIDGAALYRARTDKDISLGQLAEVAGVSRKAIQLYESGMSTMIDIALRLEEYLDIPLIRPMEPFAVKEESDVIHCSLDEPADIGIKNDIYTQLRILGYDVVPTRRSPFDALTKDKKVLIITGISEPNKLAVEKARIMTNISKITEQYSVMFLEKFPNKDNLEGTPVIHKGELEQIADSEDIITLISERS
jgi:putative transcriptional regulator